ncbi:hypothetical protein R1flu_011381 [Riccia fluitans]|uniref:EF-hand domain-containing protein n=1 Tax=Riccia fluitans TaxID=41844 RepID=A0ABD1Z8S9_9MARC
MLIPTIAKKLLPNCGKPKAPSRDHKPYVEFPALDPSLGRNSKTRSHPPDNPFSSSPSSPEISPFSSGSTSPSPYFSNSSSASSSPRSLPSTSNPPKSPCPGTPISSQAPPWLWHSRMSPMNRPPPPTTSNSNSSSASTSPDLQPRSPKRLVVDQLLELENESLMEAFRIIDSNRDGKISEEELGAMWKRLGKKMSQKELRLMIQEADTNEDGVLDLQEFVAFFSKMVVHPEIEDPIQHSSNIRLAFDLSAFARDGMISAAELQTLMKKVSRKKISAADCAAMIRFLDSDGDGLITFQEFQKLMTSTIFARRI